MPHPDAPEPDSLLERGLIRAFACERLTEVFVRCRPLRRADLMAFHSRAKMLLTAHSPVAARMLGHLVATDLPVDELTCRYVTLYLTTLWRVPSRGAHTNVLQHLAGHLRGVASVEERRLVAELIEAYRDGRAARTVPIGLLRELGARYAVDWLTAQHYLAPYPAELAP